MGSTYEGLKLSLWIGTVSTAMFFLDKGLAAQEGKSSPDAVASGRDCQHYLGSVQCLAGLGV